MMKAMKRFDPNELDAVLARLRKELAAVRRAAPLCAFGRERLVFTMKEAARRVGVSLRTLERMVAGSEVLTVLIGGARMVPASEVRHAIAARARRVDGAKSR